MGEKETEAGASDTESEIDFDPVEYEKKKSENLRRVVLAEVHYQEVRKLVRSRRFEEVRKKKDDLNDESCPDFVKRREQIYEERKKQLEDSEARYVLGRQVINNESVGRRSYLASEQNDNKVLYREQTEEHIEMALKKLTDRQSTVDAVVKVLLTLPKRKHKKKKKSRTRSPMKPSTSNAPTEKVRSCSEAGPSIANVGQGEMRSCAIFYDEPSTSMAAPVETIEEEPVADDIINYESSDEALVVDEQTDAPLERLRDDSEPDSPLQPPPIESLSLENSKQIVDEEIASLSRDHDLQRAIF